MPSEMERALDEILTGVNALLEQAPSTALGARSAVDALRAHETQSAVISVEAARLPALLSLLACVASDPDHPACASANDWIRQLLVLRAIPLGEIGSDFDDVTISPLLERPLRGLWQIGSVLADCNAEFMMWDVMVADVPRARALMGRFMGSVCPDQGTPVMRWRIPRFPERLRIRWTDVVMSSSTSEADNALGHGFIDQDNDDLRVATIFWPRGPHFVPDLFCGMAHHAGRWRPVFAQSPDTATPG